MTKTRRGPAPGLAIRVYLSAAALILFAATAIAWVGYTASRAADEQARVNEMRLFDNALRDKLGIVAHEQMSLTRWDDTVSNVVLDFERDFITTSLVDSLWYDFGHDRSALVDPKDFVAMTAREDIPDYTVRQAPESDWRRLLVSGARAIYRRDRTEIEGGFTVSDISTRADISRYASLGIVEIEGRPALAAATPIVPHDLALPDGEPWVLVSARFLSDDMLLGLNAQLGFADFSFSVSAPAGAMSRDLRTIDGRLLGAFHWTADRPGARIWSTVIPVVVALSAVLALVAFFAAHRLGTLSARLEQSEQRNRDLAMHDALTGLANRLSFRGSLDEAVATARPFALIGCDLDRFKAVNDTHGHPAGDHVIRTVAERLGYVVGEAGVVGRVGGDEFVILVTGFADRPRLSILARQIIGSVTAPIPLPDGPVVDVGISMGIAIAEGAGIAAAAINAAADEALYAAKANGRGVAVFAADLPREEPQPSNVVTITRVA